MPADPDIRYGSPAGRWLVAATVAGSGIAFLDATVVNVALPHISDDLGGGLAGLQWTLDAYLVTLTSMLLLGGSLGDRYGRRRIFVSARRVQRGVAAVRAGADHRRADRGAGAAGRRRRAAGAEQPGHHLGVVPPRRPRPRASAPGPGSAASPARSDRSSAAGSSTPCRGGRCSSSTCRSPRPPCYHPAPRARDLRGPRRTPARPPRRGADHPGAGRPRPTG